MKKHLIWLHNIVLFFLCPTYAVAAPLVMEAGFPDIPVIAYILAGIATVLGGTAGTLHRLYRELSSLPPGGELRHKWYFIATNMAGAIASGFVTFLVSTNYEWPPLMVPAAVLTAGFSGGLAMEWYVNKFFPSVKKENND